MLKEIGCQGILIGRQFLLAAEQVILGTLRQAVPHACQGARVEEGRLVGRQRGIGQRLATAHSQAGATHAHAQGWDGIRGRQRINRLRPRQEKMPHEAGRQSA